MYSYTHTHKYIYIYRYTIHESPSKSIVYAWYKSIGYRFFPRGGLSLYSVLFKSTLKNAKMQQNWFHRLRSPNCQIIDSDWGAIFLEYSAPDFQAVINCSHQASRGTLDAITLQGESRWNPSRNNFFGVSKWLWYPNSRIMFSL